jgi:fructokinase
MIVVAGEALIDMMVDAAHGGRREVPGGSPANVAVTLARLGRPVRLLARLSTDAHGAAVRAHLAGNGVDLEWAVTAAEPASVAVATIDAHGGASYDFRMDGTADWQWTPAELPDRLGPPVVALHSGSLALAMPPGARVLEDLLAAAHRAGRISVSIDLNLRPSIVGDVDAERDRVERQIRHAHIVKASAEDLAWLYPGVTPATIAAAWHADGVSCCVITCGGDGAYLLAPNGVAYRRPAVPVRVVDTVGAGDAFTGGMLDALDEIGALGSDPVDRLASVTAHQWLDVLDRAGTTAALTCTRPGADPPTRADLLNARAAAPC